MLPNDEGWAEIVRECRLSKAQQTALRATLDEVAEHCKGIGINPTDKDVKAALRKLKQAFDRLQLCLASRDVVSALGVIQTRGALGYLLSASATAYLLRQEEAKVPLVQIERLIEHKQRLDEPIMPSDLDELSIPQRQQKLNDMTLQTMQLIMEQLKQPILLWLQEAEKDRGGRRPKTERELIIFLLARDAMGIIGSKPSASTRKAFFNLCTWVLNACQIDTEGLEDAVKRCLKKYKTWFEWYYLPNLPALNLTGG